VFSCTVLYELFVLFAADDEQWAPQDDEDTKNTDPSAANVHLPQEGEGLEENDWLGREDSPSEASLEHGASGFTGHEDEDR